MAFRGRRPPARIVKTPVAAEARLGFDYLLKQSNRRTTLSLQVKDGRVEVAAPESLPVQEAHSFVADKRQWVLQQLDKQRQRRDEAADYSFEDGDRIPYLGQHYTLQIGRAPQTRVHLAEERGLLYVLLGNRSRRPRPEQVKQALQTWYRQQAAELLTGKTRVAAGRLGVGVKEVCFRQTKSKWGHCTREGVIQYNWLIMQAPVAVVDYLVAHEVSHRVHLNHSQRFWRQVEVLCPDYQSQRRWLRENSHRLGL